MFYYTFTELGNLYYYLDLEHLYHPNMKSTSIVSLFPFSSSPNLSH